MNTASRVQSILAVNHVPGVLLKLIVQLRVALTNECATAFFLHNFLCTSLFFYISVYVHNLVLFCLQIN